MNEEIKRIIEELKNNIPIEEYRSEGTSDDITHYEEDKDSWQYKVLDYITDLQQENKILKENAEHNDKVVDKAKWNEMIYKSRCKKAIERISLLKMDDITIETNKALDYVLKSLNGSDENE